MKKTLDEYLKDPDLANEPEALREVHAIRFKLLDERREMSPSEYNDIVHERASQFFVQNKSRSKKTVTEIKY